MGQHSDEDEGRRKATLIEQAPDRTVYREDANVQSGNMQTTQSQCSECNIIKVVVRYHQTVYAYTRSMDTKGKMEERVDASNTTHFRKLTNFTRQTSRLLEEAPAEARMQAEEVPGAVAQNVRRKSRNSQFLNSPVQMCCPVHNLRMLVGDTADRSHSTLTVRYSPQGRRQGHTRRSDC